ncbi:hypothetical protein [Sphingobium fuliginis]|uniref:HTH HARE-type domain-containing protein n=1 Tax=Sphingobium fuliginis (strain ATCC 27551) TaxID=336203 RepID=A0ABQ1EZU3_SPHSA|nr:hypothetical protein [Sphingobium fuliginis]RYL97622.1 hypothetical protein EWH10_13840 [Sphingobium fuliginis]GFZ94176.1 hypothetical protein GCM10019071_25570 [Sphingobium fuliginis]
MAKLNRKQIEDATRAVLERHPGGVRWAEVLKAVSAEHPETPFNSIRGATHHLFQRGDGIVKIARGTYQLVRYADADAAETVAQDEAIAAEPVAIENATTDSALLSEQDFYASFAEWLEENDEVTDAGALGGSVLGGKWGTPDVIGVLKPRAQDIFKFEPQIVTAEIKAVPGQPVVAFGQAVAYRLFSHKSYIVVPRTTTSDDMNRLTSLCSIHGVGLVVFTLNRELPDYAVVVLPTIANPDMFYVNTMLDRLKTSEPKLLNRLF